MIRCRAVLLCVATVAATLHSGEPPRAAAEKPARPAIEAGPAIGWTFPVFTDKEGYRLFTLRGAEARFPSADQIDVAEFNAVVFSGDATQQVDTILLSPQATFYPKENRATGSSTVRLILSGKDSSPANDIEVIGRGWAYQHAAIKKVTLAHDVRVTFHAQLNDILK